MKNKSFYVSIPRIVLLSKLLTDEEKILYAVLTLCIIPEKKYCNITNAELAKALNTSERTISSRLESMQKKGFVHLTMNNHLHRRLVFLRTPLKEGTFEEPPTDEELEPKKKLLLEAFKKATILGNIDFETLMQRFIDSPYLAEVKNCDTQFALNSNQIKFLADFQKFLPHKKIDCQISAFPPVDYSKLLEAIRNSKFLYESSNLNLKWFLQNSEKIINGDYEQFIDLHETPYKSNYKSRDYEPNELNSPFTIDPDQIDIGDNDTNHEIESKPFVEQKKGKKPKIFSHQELNKIFKHL